jgi:transcriptional regulator with XRE-family HTH domain
MPRRPRTAEDDASFEGLGQAIAAIREQRGLSRDELAKQIDDEPAIVERIEQGSINADWATLRTIAHALAVPLPSLFELAEELAPGPGGEQWRQQTEAATSDD